MVYFDSLSEYVYKSHFFGDYDAFLKTYKTFPTEILSNIYPDEGLNGLLVRKIFTQKQFVYTLDKDSEIEQQKKSTPTLKKMVEVLKRKHSSKNKETFMMNVVKLIMTIILKAFLLYIVRSKK
jgi:hypothetical protein